MNEEIKRINKKIESLIKIKIVKIKLIHTGNNSSVYYIQTLKKNEYIVKKYPAHIHDTRNRLSNEITALNFVNHYFRLNVPKVINYSEDEDIGIYSYIYGKRPEKTDISKNVILQSLDFIIELQSLRDKTGIWKIKKASEACLNIKDHDQIISERLSRIHRSLGNNYYDSLCNKFIEKRLKPWYREISSEIRKKSNIKKASLNKKNQILSPSDFGFHNMIVNKNKVYFTDFEYFGWDDPAKFLSDFYLQPDMPLPYKYREFFFRKIEAFLEDSSLIRRFYEVYLYTGVKWILIMLNPYARNEIDKQIKSQRLKKCNEYLDMLINEYNKKIFPLNIKFYA